MATQRQLSRLGARVAIIGGGFAGLRCADVLIQSGVTVTIFEARNRLGGRVHQTSTGDHIVDMGPNWIHGTQDNPVEEIAQRTATVTIAPDEQQLIFDANGNRKSNERSRMLGAEFWGTIVDAFKYSKDCRDFIDPQTSLMDFFRAELPKRFPKDEQKVEEILQEAQMWGFFVGGTIERQSLKCFFLEECLEGENTFVASSYEPILRHVSANALSNADIRLNEEIVQVVYRDAGEENNVVLLSKFGHRYEFDEVVVTCPLGWLKANQASFIPPLPVRLSQAIENLGYGRLEKLNGISFGGSSSAGNAGARTPMFMHFQSPTYHPFPESTKSNTWNVSVVSMAHLPSPVSHPTLLFYLYGDCGAFLTFATAQHAPQSEDYNRILNDFSKPFLERMPNYSSQRAECVASSFALTSWQTDPHAGHGSYTNFQIGLEQGDIDIKTIRDAGGMSDAGRGLWFAGEHTAPFIAVGTTTGAYWSGEAVGQRIVEAYKSRPATGTHMLQQC